MSDSIKVIPIERETRLPPLPEIEKVLSVPGPSTGVDSSIGVMTSSDSNPDAIKRRLLLEKLRDDRADLVRVAHTVREIAETVETAQITLAFSRRSLRFLLLAGSAAALTLWLTNGRRSRAALYACLSMQVVRRWLGPESPPPPLPSIQHLPASAHRRARAA